jgi:hypothetical protein
MPKAHHRRRGIPYKKRNTPFTKSVFPALPSYGILAVIDFIRSDRIEANIET